MNEIKHNIDPKFCCRCRYAAEVAVSRSHIGVRCGKPGGPHDGQWSHGGYAIENLKSQGVDVSCGGFEEADDINERNESAAYRAAVWKSRELSRRYYMARFTGEEVPRGGLYRARTVIVRTP